MLSDGMGGHRAGDLASRMVVTEMFGDLKFHAPDLATQERRIPALLGAAMDAANESLARHAAEHPETRGMGATLIALILIEARLFWMSVGDSPLYLFRDSRLRRLNEDHSLAPEIDRMVDEGLMSPRDGRDHPDRSGLTSVVMGEEIARRDCPETPLALREGDLIVAASDGLDGLGMPELQRLLLRHGARPSVEIVAQLLEAVEALEDPDQDNVSLSVVKLNHDRPATAIARPAGRATRAMRAASAAIAAKVAANFS